MIVNDFEEIAKALKRIQAEEEAIREADMQKANEPDSGVTAQATVSDDEWAEVVMAPWF